MSRRLAAVRRSGLRLFAAFALVIAGVALAAVVQLSTGAGLPASVSLVGVGSAATVSSSESATTAGAPGRFLISGGVTGLYPGATLPLTLTISNPQPFAIVVTSVTVAIGTGSPACASSNLSVSPFSGTLTVPAKGSATMTLSATLAHSAGDGCEGAVFPLQYAGMAVKQ